ncbi:MAG TPA: hypothetical protein EYG85_12675 [Crocinitomix sp.]|nr:hypothetical protein [Crocinitomix sp.]
MKHIKYWLINITVLTIIVSCNETQNDKKIETIIDIEDTKEENFSGTIDSTSKSIVQYDSIINKKEKIIIEQENKPSPLIIDNTTTDKENHISEQDYWKWRESVYYKNDSLGQFEVYKMNYYSKFPNSDSLKLMESWVDYWWNKYIYKIETKDVLWDKYK